MKKILSVSIFLLLLIAPVLAQAVRENASIIEPVPEIPYYRHFYISIKDKFVLGEEVEARVCGSGLATLEIYRFENLSVLFERFKGYGKEEDFLAGEKPFKTITIQLGQECEELDLQIEQAGLYFVKGYSTESENEPIAMFSVEEIALMVKESPEKILFYATDINTGKPIPNAEIKLLEQKQALGTETPEIEEKSLGFTNDLGLLEWKKGEVKEDFDYKGQLFIVQKNDSFAFVQGYYWRRSEEQNSLYIFTDRPIYRPNQIVHFKGILWKTGVEKHALEGETVSITIRDAKWNEVFKKDFTTNEFGSIEGEFTLTDEPPLGRYNIEARKNEKYLGNAYFQVEEYRKPEFEVKVNPSKDVFIGGEKARVEIKAEYFFKSPVQDAKVMYRVYSSHYREPCYGYWKCIYYEPLTEYYPGIIPPYPYYEKQLVTEGETVTDSEGKAFIEFDTNADREKRYFIEATVVDESNRQVSGSGTVIVVPALFRLTVIPDKWWYAENEEIRLKINAKDLEGKPIDTEATVKVYSLQWNTESKEYNRELAKEEIVATNEGKAELRFTLPAGQYAVEATAVDELGNTVKAENSLSVRGKERESRVQEIEVLLDRELYTPGEDALLTITAPEPDYYALISIESRGLFHYEVIHSLEEEFSYIIPIISDYEPNAFVTVTGIQNGKVFMKTLSLNVPPNENKIDLSIETDSDYYYPRQTAHYTVKATSNGKPVEAEFAVMLVDEAIFQLAEDNKKDIFQFFFKPEYNWVSTQWSLREYYYYPLYGIRGAGIMEETMPMPMAQKVVEEAGYAVPEVRKTFADTAYWKAFLKTNSEGIAEFDVVLPDNLTTWRAAVIANSKNKAGMQEDKIASTKDVIARLIVPKFVVQGDKFTITAIVHNNLPEMKDALVRIESDNIEFPDGNSEELTIASGRSEKVEFSAIAKKCCTATIKLEALTDIESDAIEIVMPVFPWGIKEFETVSGEVNETVEIGIEFPEETVREADKLIIKLDPTLAGTIINSLDYLTGYPYGCVEQTMSRFLPDVIVAKALNELNLENEKLKKELPKMVEKGLQKLYGFQLSDGGWGWWRNDSSQPFMTAYVLYGLTLAKQAGFEVNEDVLAKGKLAAIKHFDETSDREVQAFLSYALYLNGDSRFVEELKEHAGEMSDYGKALLVLQIDSEEEAKPYLDELLENASCGLSFCSWSGKTWRKYWSERNTETTAIVLKAIVKFEPENERVRKAINWLLMKREYSHWRSTQDSAMVVLALTDYLKYSGELEPNYTARVYINNELKKEFSVTRDNMFEVDSELSISEPKKNSVVRIEMEGKGKLYYSITKEYFSKQEEISAKDNGIKITRIVENEIDIGEEAVVKLKIETDREYDYVIVEDYLPAGVTVVDARKRGNYGYYWSEWYPYWYARMETRDEKVVFFFRELRKGETELEYMVRGEVSGAYKHLSAQAYLMYNPEINGHSTGNTFIVTKEKSFSLPKIEIKDDYIWIYPRPIPLEASVKATVVDNSGNEIVSTEAEISNGKARIPLTASLGEGLYSVKVSIESEGQTYSETKDFQVGRVEVKRTELADVGYSNELVERTKQAKLESPAQGMCNATGGTWSNGQCACPEGHYWVFGVGCEAKAYEPRPAADSMQLLVIGIALSAIIVAFVLFLKRKPKQSA